MFVEVSLDFAKILERLETKLSTLTSPKLFIHSQFEWFREGVAPERYS
jgi:hypothetical protein